MNEIYQTNSIDQRKNLEIKIPILKQLDDINIEHKQNINDYSNKNIHNNDIYYKSNEISLSFDNDKNINLMKINKIMSLILIYNILEIFFLNNKNMQIIVIILILMVIIIITI